MAYLYLEISLECAAYSLGLENSFVNIEVGVQRIYMNGANSNVVNFCSAKKRKVERMLSSRKARKLSRQLQKESLDKES